MSELNARGVTDEARQFDRQPPPLASPLAVFQVEMDPVAMMTALAAATVQNAQLKKAVFGQALLTARAEEELRYWRAKALLLAEKLKTES